MLLPPTAWCCRSRRASTPGAAYHWCFLLLPLLLLPLPLVLPQVKAGDEETARQVLLFTAAYCFYLPLLLLAPPTCCVPCWCLPLLCLLPTACCSHSCPFYCRR